MKLILPEWGSEALYNAMLADWGGEDIVPGAVRPNGKTYAEWLKSTILSRTRPPKGLVPGTTFFMTDDDMTKIYGMVSVRHTLNEYLLDFGGHIGYGIVPSERGKGYAKEQLRLVLPIVRALGITRALVTCENTNAASAHTIEACGGVPEDRRGLNGKIYRRYWIDIEAEPIETERLLLRGWTLDDAEAMYAYAVNPKIGPAAGWKPHESVEESREIVEIFLKSGATWAIVEKASGAVIGSIGLERDDARSNPRAKMIGYVLREESWGRGYMTEAVRALTAFAFERLCMNVLSIKHYAFNTRSRRVIEKCGYRYEGTLRNADSIFDGSVQDDCCWSLLRTEYFQQKEQGK